MGLEPDFFCNRCMLFAWKKNYYDWHHQPQSQEPWPYEVEPCCTTHAIQATYIIENTGVITYSTARWRTSISCSRVSRRRLSEVTSFFNWYRIKANHLPRSIHSFHNFSSAQKTSHRSHKRMNVASWASACRQLGFRASNVLSNGAALTPVWSLFDVLCQANVKLMAPVPIYLHTYFNLRITHTECFTARCQKYWN